MLTPRSHDAYGREDDDSAAEVDATLAGNATASSPLAVGTRRSELQQNTPARASQASAIAEISRP